MWRPSIGASKFTWASPERPIHLLRRWVCTWLLYSLHLLQLLTLAPTNERRNIKADSIFHIHIHINWVQRSWNGDGIGLPRVLVLCTNVARTHFVAQCATSCKNLNSIIVRYGSGQWYMAYTFWNIICCKCIGYGVRLTKPMDVPCLAMHASIMVADIQLRKCTSPYRPSYLATLSKHICASNIFKPFFWFCETNSMFLSVATRLYAQILHGVFPTFHTVQHAYHQGGRAALIRKVHVVL